MSQKFYYSVSVRGGLLPKETVIRQIEILKRYGIVLTEHLASDNSAVVDMGKNDNDIYQADMDMLQQADIFVADITAPSLGVGFMIRDAIEKNKPVVCFHQKDKCPKVSAMINGCPKVTIYPYGELEVSNDSFETGLRRFLAKQISQHKIFLIGPPGSGKSTIAKNLAWVYNLKNISTGQILRELIKDKSHPLFGVIDSYMSKGQLVPSNIMCDIVSNALISVECQKNGFVLDGYPPSYDDLLNLRKYDILPDIVFYFECLDETAIKRQCGRGERQTDTVECATERIKEYHRGVPDYYTVCKKWFPTCPVVRIDAEEKSDIVIDKVAQITHKIYNRTPRNDTNISYFPIQPYQNNLQSGKFHFHVDAENHANLLDIVYGIFTTCPELQGQIKIYPISDLVLGSQIKTDAVYKSMINFHEIREANDEAFATGRFGKTVNVELVKRILAVFEDKNLRKRIYPRGCSTGNDGKFMFEIEQFIGSWILKKGMLITDGDFTDEIKFDKELLSQYDKYLVPNCPPFELHLAFDITKTSTTKPIDLLHLNKQCEKAGLNNGGWFIFKNKIHWAYRTNEFNYDTREIAEAKVKSQAFILAKILEEYGFTDLDISLSLEIVHGIWVFN